MLRGKAWKCLGVGAIGAVVGIGSLLAAVVQVLSLFAGTLQDQQINLVDIGCPAVMTEDMGVGRCTITTEKSAVLVDATNGIGGCQAIRSKSSLLKVPSGCPENNSRTRYSGAGG